MRVALVYDRVNKFGGAERLLLALHRLFPKAPLFTLVHNPPTSRWAKDIKVVPTFLNKFPLLRTKHEWLAPIAPMAFETLNLSDFDIVISVTSAEAKAVITRPHQLHICYCLTPTRYYWSGYQHYASDIKFKIIPSFLKKYFRSVDLLISRRPDEYIAISKEVKNRIREYYKRPSGIIYPPIEDKFYSKKIIATKERLNYLLVSRLVPYKKVSLAIDAFNKLGKPLTIVGNGSELSHLKQRSKPNISFAGSLNDSNLVEQYRHAKAVIFPTDEDYGLVPIESQACGTPVIAYAKGGALETVLHKKTGYLFPEQTESSLIKAVKEFESINIDPENCRKNARCFDFDTFSNQFRTQVELLWNKHSQG